MFRQTSFLTLLSFSGITEKSVQSEQTEFGKNQVSTLSCLVTWRFQNKVEKLRFFRVPEFLQFFSRFEMFQDFASVSKLSSESGCKLQDQEEQD